MIIVIEPGGRAKVPTERDFLVRTATAFDPGELAGVIPVLQYRGFQGSAGEIPGTVDGVDFLFPIAPGDFSPGEWTINFKATVSGKVRGWLEPAVLDFEDPLVAGCVNAC